MRMLTVAALLAISLLAAAAGPVNEEAGVALAGHDPVAYFTAAKPVAGRADLTAAHAGATYRFATPANRDAFVAAPEKFLPQYGGYCAYGMARGYKAVVDPTAFTIANGKLYLNYNHDVQASWRKAQASQIARADSNWPAAMNKPDVAR